MAADDRGVQNAAEGDEAQNLHREGVARLGVLVVRCLGLVAEGALVACCLLGAQCLAAARVLVRDAGADARPVRVIVPDEGPARVGVAEHGCDAADAVIELGPHDGEWHLGDGALGGQQRRGERGDGTAPEAGEGDGAAGGEDLPSCEDGTDDHARVEGEHEGRGSSEGGGDEHGSWFKVRETLANKK